MVEKLKALEAQGLSGSIYTQTTDIEQEQNGLMTYDRAVARIPVAELAKLNAKLVPMARNYFVATRDFAVPDPDVTPEAQRYATLLAAYQNGNRDLSFLRRVTLMALRQKDQARATEIGNDYINRTPRPYSKDTWQFIKAVTRTPEDTGFKILRSHVDEANSNLGPDAAETTIRQAIVRGEIEPHISDKGPAPDWIAIERNVSTTYGALGAEAVYGAEMLYYLEKQDWQKFATYYVRYFGTATARSEYPVDNFSYALFEHVTAPDALNAAIVAVKYDVDKSGAEEPTEIDTYANLLYKSGRAQEAITWEEKAASLSEGRDQEIANHLKKMQAGQPTWPVS
jgi:hypothetical protein